MTKQYRIARMQYLFDLVNHIAEQEPMLVEMTDWHSNTDALVQMIKLIEEE